MEARGYVVSEEIRNAMENIAFGAMTKNNIVEELTHANARITDTVHSLQGDNTKLITMMGLCQPTNAGTGGDDKLDWYLEGYCWPHGSKVRLDHNSGNFGSPQAGHKRRQTEPTLWKKKCGMGSGLKKASDG